MWSAGIDAGYSVKQNNNGEFIIVGETYTSGTAGTDVFVMKLAPDDKVILNTDLFGVDGDDDGFAEGTVDGSQSFVTYGSIISYKWFIDDSLVSNAPSFQLTLPSGSRFIKLLLTTSKGNTIKDSVEI